MRDNLLGYGTLLFRCYLAQLIGHLMSSIFGRLYTCLQLHLLRPHLRLQLLSLQQLLPRQRQSRGGAVVKVRGQRG